jgi:hypothetical protein
MRSHRGLTIGPAHLPEMQIGRSAAAISFWASPVRIFRSSFARAVATSPDVRLRYTRVAFRAAGRSSPPCLKPSIIGWLLVMRQRQRLSRFYSYAYPVPPGFADATVKSEAATSPRPGANSCCLLRCAALWDPEAAPMAVIKSTYRAATDFGGWDCCVLEHATASA